MPAVQGQSLTGRLSQVESQVRFRIVPRPQQDLTKWHVWFVALPMTIEGHCVFMERVHRRLIPGYLQADGHFEYALLDIIY